MNPQYVIDREIGRRAFLRRGFASAAGLLGIPLLGGCDPKYPKDEVVVGNSEPVSNIVNLGPLGPTDANGVRLPPGFTSRLIAHSGRAPVGGNPKVWHASPDGGACFSVPGGGWIYVSNSEVSSGGGGAGAVRFDSTGALVDCYSILTGTSKNCAGGKMPWGTWLSCEENGDTGAVYECDPTGVSPATLLPGLGRFNHEAAAWDTGEGRLYMTEDRGSGGFYRFTPATFTAPGIPDLRTGLLEVAQVAGGPEGAVSWLAVPDPSGAVTPTRDQLPAMTPFNGGEGITFHAGRICIATKGDNRIWSYDIATGLLVILYDVTTSPTPILSGVDNIEVSVGGDLLVAEDGGDLQIVAVAPSGAIVPLLQLVGHNGSEVTGPAFDPGGTRLYFSSQKGTLGSGSDGMTFEVTGPFVV